MFRHHPVKHKWNTEERVSHNPGICSLRRLYACIFKSEERKEIIYKGRRALGLQKDEDHSSLCK